MSVGVTVILTAVEVSHLLTLLVDAEAEGAYYGPREVYWNRHERIKQKLAAAVAKLAAADKDED